MGGENMLILAFDTSTHVGSMALLAGGELLAERSVSVRASHGEALLPHLSELLEHANVSLSAVDLFAVGIGPGAFTGVRIGVATAKGLAFAEAKPLVGVHSLRAMARGASSAAGLIVPLVDAYKGEVYAAVYAQPEDSRAPLEERLEPFHAAPRDAVARIQAACAGSPLCWLGSGAARYGELFGEQLGEERRCPAFCNVPRAVCVAHESALLFGLRGADDAATLEPLYVRPSDAKLPKV